MPGGVCVEDLMFIGLPPVPEPVRAPEPETPPTLFETFRQMATRQRQDDRSCSASGRPKTSDAATLTCEEWYVLPSTVIHPRKLPPLPSTQPDPGTHTWACSQC